MSNSIYSNFTFQPNTQYFLNDISTDGVYFYYATTNFISSTNIQNDINAGNFIGITNFNNINKPYFSWRSSYKFGEDFVPRIREIQLGDGYVQRASDGINNILMNINFPFTNIDLNQYTAILHFLDARKGVESFVFIPPAPHNIQKLFVCKKWNTVQNFYNNYDINANFVETVV